MAECNVALYGCGTVGAGVAAILIGRSGALADRIGGRVRLKYVVDARKDEVAAELRPPDSVQVTDDLDGPMRDPEVSVVVELIGGTGIARTVVENALRAGKDVVTANKALLAECGGELFRLARANGRSIAFEAAVAGGIPIIAALRNAMVGERLESIYGIVNGTCNYVLTRMSRDKLSYHEALSEAQEKGYAEADPTLDVEGHDAAHKLAVLARLAFGVDVCAADIPCEGISAIEPADLVYAHGLGYTAKLLATGIRRGDAVELRVHPTLLHHEHPLASVGGAYNAVCVHGDCVGEVVLTGLGAGRWATASAVVADVCRVALGTYGAGFAALRQFGDVAWANIVPLAEVRMGYYFRLSCLDMPGVLARVAGILGRHAISISSVIQQDISGGGASGVTAFGQEGPLAAGASAEDRVPVVFMLHEAQEGALQGALRDINQLDCIDGDRTRMFRVQDI